VKEIEHAHTHSCMCVCVCVYACVRAYESSAVSYFSKSQHRLSNLECVCLCVSESACVRACSWATKCHGWRVCVRV